MHNYTSQYQLYAIFYLSLLGSKIRQDNKQKLPLWQVGSGKVGTPFSVHCPVLSDNVAQFPDCRRCTSTFSGPLHTSSLDATICNVTQKQYNSNFIFNTLFPLFRATVCIVSRQKNLQCYLKIKQNKFRNYNKSSMFFSKPLQI